MNNNIKLLALRKSPGCAPTLVRLPAEPNRQLVSLHNLVEGYFESVFINPAGRLFLLCNDEGKLNPFCLPNLKLREDIIFGTVVIVKIDSDGDIVSMSEEDITAGKRWLKMHALGSLSSLLGGGI